MSTKVKVGNNIRFTENSFRWDTRMTCRVNTSKDISISTGIKKQENDRVNIIMRNDVWKLFSTGYIKIGISQWGDAIAFTTSRAGEGWKLSGNGSTRTTSICSPELVNVYKKYVGDYDLEETEDGIHFIRVTNETNRAMWLEK